jgi:hypothetical protein
MSNAGDRAQSNLFLLRLWATVPGERESTPPEGDPAGCEGGQWEGRLLNVFSGEGHNFDDWCELIKMLRAMLAPGRRESG